MENNLHNIRKFPDLVRYLEDQLGWPVEEENFEDLTFEYNPAELGLKSEEAAAVKKIHQLRPLYTGQPWGVFFVEFEKKKLPVVVLRRILSHLVIKKRSSANKADQAAWNPGDLLFISAFGDEATVQREMAFAHFHQNSGDLPTLRVLGWDGGDTQLKLEHVTSELQNKLRWPADPKNVSAWRTQWSGAFRHRLGHVVRTADHLAEVLAVLARNIRDRCTVLIRAESDHGPLTKLFKAFQDALIHDLNPETFADTYAQTITYGLLTAAINRTDMSGGTEATYVKADDLTLMVRSTSPFLKEMLETFLTVGGRKKGMDFDELGIQDVVELLRGDETDLPAILRDFGNRTRGEDPVIHFYEHFLSAYNKKLKIQRGVFYTPQPVVSYIVRSVHELLQTELGLEEGLASTITWGEMALRHPGLKLPPKSDEHGEMVTIDPDEPFVQILDPATGTATFLVESVDVIFKALKEKWEKSGATVMPVIKKLKLKIQNFSDYWNAYVPEHLLPRLHGYELLAAPYAIAHLKLGLKLSETGYRFGSTQRACIYLTNALEPKVRQLPQIGFEPLAHEAKAVNEIKWYKRFTVIIGNPPYAGYSANEGAWIENLMEKYKITVRDEERQIQRLSNDYVKFIRFSEWLLSGSGIGILGLITDNGYLNGILFRDMRCVLQNEFQLGWINNLHGVAMRGAEKNVGVDENVFQITQGVAICIFARRPNNVTVKKLSYADLIGSRQNKYAFLSQSTLKGVTWTSISPSTPKYLFVPASSDENYDSWPLFTELVGTGSPKSDRDLRYGTGIKTRHDEFVVGWNDDDAIARVKQIAHREESDAELIKELGLCTTAHFSIKDARKRAETKDLSKYIKSIAYRPFDWRSIVYLREFVCEPKIETMSHMLNGKNIAMAILRRDRKENGAGFFVARGLIAKDLVSNLDDALVWPLYLLKDEYDLLTEESNAVGTANLSRWAIEQFTTRLGLRWQESGEGDLDNSVGPEDIFCYLYALFYSPSYRNRYAEFLKIDFPRIPIIRSRKLFCALARLGGELVALHLLESSILGRPITEYLGSRTLEVEKVSWFDNTIWLDKEQTTGFKGVSEDVWNFHIGGYQVCEKWLKDRKGRQLSAEDRTHYQKVIVALSETIRLMKEIDQVIEKHGGWPLK